jgi:MFS family permease
LNHARSGQLALDDLPAPPAVPTGDLAWPRQSYCWFLVGVLFLCYCFSYVDRQLLNLLVDPIEADLGISDTQFSLLQGFAFGLLYAVSALPIGWLVDSTNRKNIMSIGVFLWSIATMLSGLARSFTMLFMCRVAVGVGEAALSPAAYSTMSDSIRPARLPLAISIYTVGMSVGMGGAYLLGGKVVEICASLLAHSQNTPGLRDLHAWQLGFLVVAAPGFLLAVILWCLREPRRRGTERDGTRSVRLSETISYLAKHWRTFVPLLLGLSVASAVDTGVTAWLPAFAARTFGMGTEEAGFWLGTCIATFGSLGIIGAGWWAEHLIKRGVKDAVVRVLIWCVLLGVPFLVIGPMVHSLILSLIIVGIGQMFVLGPWGIAGSAIQFITPNRLRGQISALYLFIVSVIGSAGPLAIAYTTDHILRDAQSINLSIAIISITLSPIAIVLLYQALRPYGRLIAENTVEI